jgi:hypothetical protein
MPSGQRSILARVAWQGVRGAVALTALLIIGYFILSRDGLSDSKNIVEDDDANKKTAASVAGREDTTVKLDAEAQEKGGIETAPPKEITYQGEIRAFGVILPLDRLTSLFNNSLVAAAQLKSAQIKLEASKIANSRAQNLLKVFPTAAAQAEAADASYKMDLAGVEAAQVQVETLRNTAIQEWGPVLGEAIVARSALAEDLVRHKSCLIQLTLQPGAMVSAPATIGVTLGSASTAEAKLVSEATQADLKIPNVAFFYTIPNGPAALVGMNVAAVFPKGVAKQGIGIPPSAVIWQAGRAWMYVQDGTDRFERRPIGDEASPTAEGGYVLPAASWPHDKLIVIAGAQTLLSEEAKSQGQSDEDDN